MPSYGYGNTASGGPIKPGQTWHVHWNNAHPDAVYAFSLGVYGHKWSALTTDLLRLEITKVEYRRVHKGGSAQPESEVHVWIKNVGGVDANYDLNHSWVLP